MFLNPADSVGSDHNEHYAQVDPKLQSDRIYPNNHLFVERSKYTYTQQNFLPVTWGKYNKKTKTSNNYSN